MQIVSGRQFVRTQRGGPVMSRTLTGLSLLLILLLPCTSSTLAQAEAGTWSSADSMHDPRDGHTATLLSNGKLLIAGGCAGENGNSLGLASAELYNPATGTWTLTGSMTTARVGPTATLLPGGAVLVAGGIDVDQQILLGSAELYNPTTGSWTVTGSLNIARHLHTATLLPGGKILVVGGSGRDASAELYDPATGTWTLTGSMTTARVEHTATLLASGKVLVVDRTTQASPGVGNRLASLTSVAGFVAIDAPIATEGRLSISALIERKARIA